MSREIVVHTPDTLAAAQAEREGADLAAPIAIQGLSAEAAKSVAEAQAALLVARGAPRQPGRAQIMMRRECARESLAEVALYAYRRGGTMIEGPSIRLAESLAKCYQHVHYGFREIARRPGESEFEAYAWDLENNVRAERRFVVRHARDTKQGVVEVTDERDKYEVTASMAQRRVRACILEIVPGDLVDEAVTLCKKTLAAGGGKPLADRVRDLVASFAEIGVSTAILEAFIGHPIAALVEAEIPKLRAVYGSLKNGLLTVGELVEKGKPRAGLAAQENTAPAPAPVTESVDPQTGEVASPGPENAGPPAWKPPAPPKETATVAQVKRMFAACKAKNYTEADIRKAVETLFPGTKSTKDLTGKQLDTLVELAECGELTGTSDETL